MRASALERDFRFPGPAAYRARYAPVLWEPIAGSGERLTALIGARGADERIKVVQAVRPEVLEVAFGARAANACGLLRLVGESLVDHLQRCGEFAGWTPPLDGFFEGAPVEGAGDDLDGVLRQAIRLRAAFGSLERFEVLSVGGDSRE